MNAPIFYLSFANTKPALPNLVEESDRITKALSTASKEQRIVVHLDNFATIDKIAAYLTSYKDSIILFHYGGHANSQQLILDDQATNASGIAQLLAAQKNLQVVFLNGCSTKEQVSTLLALGIPIVIATSASINDQLAMEFADSFYQAIANEYTILAAFNIAKGVVQAKTGRVLKIYRETELREGVQTTFSWGLYTNLADAELDKILIPPKNDPMDLINKAIPLILAALEKPENTPFKEWIQPILWKNEVTKSMLEMDIEQKVKETVLKKQLLVLESDPTFRAQLQEWMTELAPNEDAEKNVIDDSDIQVKGDFHNGDKGISIKESYKKKNIIKGSTIKVEGDFTQGDHFTS